MLNLGLKSFILILLISTLPNGSHAQFESQDQSWFCRSTEAVEPCENVPSSVDRFNNERVYPVLQKLLQKDFFKFYKVNMERPCPLWPDNKECSSKECGIEHCDDEVPAALKNPASFRSTVRLVSNSSATHNSSGVVLTNSSGLHSSTNSNLPTTCSSQSSQSPSPTPTTCSSFKQIENGEAKSSATEKDPKCSTGNQFDPIDTSLTEGDKAQLDVMDYFEDSSDRFCDVEDDNSTDLHYVNLAKNPERYTGYKGESAQKIWQCIYQENCFKPDSRFDKDFLLNPSGNNGMCLEKRVFYRLISGLHSAITVSIAAYNYKPAVGGFGTGTWFRNVEMFKGRFGTKWSMEGPERLKNIYFVYLLELRALVKVAPYLQQEMFHTGNEEEDAQTRQLIEQLIEICKSFDNHYDETTMFTGIDSQARLLREEFRQHFLNISRIMDCVGCDKCRLWGKLQTHGMGTALKILFSGMPQSQRLLAPDGKTEVPFKLTRNEVVALMQSFGRYSSTINEIDEFRRAIFPELTDQTSSKHSEL